MKSYPFYSTFLSFSSSLAMVLSFVLISYSAEATPPQEDDWAKVPLAEGCYLRLHWEARNLETGIATENSVVLNTFRGLTPNSETELVLVTKEKISSNRYAFYEFVVDGRMPKTLGGYELRFGSEPVLSHSREGFWTQSVPKPADHGLWSLVLTDEKTAPIVSANFLTEDPKEKSLAGQGVLFDPRLFKDQTESTVSLKRNHSGFGWRSILSEDGTNNVLRESIYFPVDHAVEALGKYICAEECSNNTCPCVRSRKLKKVIQGHLCTDCKNKLAQCETSFAPCSKCADHWDKNSELHSSIRLYHQTQCDSECSTRKECAEIRLARAALEDRDAHLADCQRALEVYERDLKAVVETLREAYDSILVEKERVPGRRRNSKTTQAELNFAISEAVLPHVRPMSPLVNSSDRSTSPSLSGGGAASSLNSSGSLPSAQGLRRSRNREATPPPVWLGLLKTRVKQILLNSVESLDEEQDDRDE